MPGHVRPSFTVSSRRSLKEPPKSENSMAKTINVSFSTATSFYLSVACTGYAALGASTPGDIVVGFNVSDVVEVIANVATVLLHMISLVQVITQVGCFTLIIHILYLYRGKWFCMYIYISLVALLSSPYLSLYSRLLRMTSWLGTPRT